MSHNNESYTGPSSISHPGEVFLFYSTFGKDLSVLVVVTLIDGNYWHFMGKCQNFEMLCLE